MSEQKKSHGSKEDQVPGGDLSGNEDGASSDGDSGPQGAGGTAPSGKAGEDEAQSG